MHTILVIGGGLVLLAVCILVGRMTGGPAQSVTAASALYFLPLWLVAAAINMWVGVSKAGYSVAEELLDLPVDLRDSGVDRDLPGWWKYSRG